jgi:hypothetical protein
MGFACGFDIVPNLKADAHRDAYKRFIDEIIGTYEDLHDPDSRHPDQKILELPTDDTSSDKHNIRFTVGDYPSIPFYPEHCGHFLRFSSQVSARLAAPAEVYIKEICDIAKKHLGKKKVRWWNEMQGTHGRYEKQVVRDTEDELKKKPVAGHDCESQPPVSIQRNDLTSYCPAFQDLPGEHDLDQDYYTSNGSSYRPAKNWCFLGQITGVDGFLRMRFIVRDNEGLEVPISFHTGDRGFDISPALTKKGNTIAILYAEQHAFMDFSTGVRVESMNHVKVSLRNTAQPCRLLIVKRSSTNPWTTS